MELLQAGVDRSVIALWLGHESIETTQMYLDADLALKEKAMSKTTPLPGGKPIRRFRPDDRLLAFRRRRLGCRVGIHLQRDGLVGRHGCGFFGGSGAAQLGHWRPQ